jgi:hypothetical protein
MGGQDGYSRDLLTYNEEANTLLGGIKIRPGTKWDLGIYLSYTAAEAGLDPFDLPADDYVATHPPTAYDFSASHTYSDLDVSRMDGDLMIKYKFSDAMWLRFNWRYVDYTDDAPYLEDTSGTVQWATLSAGWYF